MQSYISILIFAKIFFASLTLYFLSVYLGWDMFTYPDFYSVYNKCEERSYTNIFFTNLFCSLSFIADTNLSHRSAFFVVSACLVNILILVSYFKIFEKYLSNNGKYFLILLLVLHPYMNIYFFRFYTDLFASLGVLLVFFYKMKNININLSFVIAALILMNFRNALIPVFFVYGLWEIYFEYNKNKPKALFFSLLLVFTSLVSYLRVMEFGMTFVAINSNIGLFEKIIGNIVLLLGYRESLAINRDMLDISTLISKLSLLASLVLIIIHSMGIYGVFKFSKKIDKSILIIFIYVFFPILAVAHMRYLIPLMPILLFGLAYLFFQNDKNS